MTRHDHAVIRAAREAAGLTQAQAAALIGRGWRVWAAYEAGTREIDPILWQVWRIRAGLAAPASILAGGYSPPRSAGGR
jgi:transcriptional regulator with XRE-family HTH domain